MTWTPSSLVYPATKSAVDSITRGLANELGARRIRVNTIAPGGVETEGHRLGIIGNDFEKQIVSETPLGRIGQPDDIARIAVFLASDDAGWMTGERISASGGRTARRPVSAEEVDGKRGRPLRSGPLP